MYLVSVLLLLLVFPVGTIYAEHSYLHDAMPLMLLVGKWFVFWGAGARLFLAASPDSDMRCKAKETITRMSP